MPVLVGAQQLPMQLVAAPVSERCYRRRCAQLHQRARRKGQPVSQQRLKLARWTIYLTSRTGLNFAQVHALYRARWQIECLFKRWKSLAQLTHSTTRDPHRQACEFYAKLLAVLLAHWLTQAHAWSHLRVSFDKVFTMLQTYAAFIHAAFFGPDPFPDRLAAFFNRFCRANTLSRRKTHPNPRDFLLAFDDLA